MTKARPRRSRAKAPETPVLERVDYDNLRTAHAVATVEGVAYLGIRRGSGGAMCLAFRKGGATRATLVEVGAVKRIVHRGRTFEPGWYAGWEKRAAEIEAFVADPEAAPAEPGLLRRLLGG